MPSLKYLHDNCNINTQNDIIYQYLSLPWHALYYITTSYERTCIMCMSSSTTDIAVGYGAYVWIFIDEVFSDVCWEALETVRSNFLEKVYRNWVNHFREVYSNYFISIKCPCAKVLVVGLLQVIFFVPLWLPCYIYQPFWMINHPYFILNKALGSGLTNWEYLSWHGSYLTTHLVLQFQVLYVDVDIPHGVPMKIRKIV